MLRKITSIATIAFGLSYALPALASDYSHTCRSADGNYQMDDGALSRANSDASSGSELSYTSLKETVLKSEIGYCITKTGKKYDFEFKSYTKRIKFEDDGQPFELDMVCELASDGLPANEVCKRTVTTSKTGASDGKNDDDVGKPAPGSQGWTHNGSGMKLIANGKQRRFQYDIPRAALKSVGVKRGDTVFSGSRNGNEYSGTAYIFKKGCDPQGYPVSGPVSNDERTITLTGQRPHIGNGCSVDRYSDDTLVFELPSDDDSD
jgi:hypothetical protein